MTGKTQVDGRGRKSRILTGLNRLTSWLYAWILDSALGRYMTGYSRTEKAFSEGYFYRFFHGKRKRSDRLLFRMRMAVSASIEHSAVSRILAWLSRLFLQASVNTYGVFFLFFGSYSIATYFVVKNLNVAAVSFSYVVAGSLMVLFGVPLLFSKRSLAWILQSSSISRAVLMDVFGIQEERLKAYGEAGREYFLEALILSVVSGALTFLYPPYLIPLIVIGMCAVWVVMKFPEVGMVLSVGLCPFLSLTGRATRILLLMMCLTMLSFFGKLICGKRVIRLQLADICVLLLMALYLLGGAVSSGGADSFRSGLTYAVLMVIYFMASNLIRTEQGFRRVRITMVVGATVVALFGLWQHFFGHLEIRYLDLAMFRDLGGRVYSTFDNPNFLAEYLILLMPMALCGAMTEERWGHRALSLASFAVMGACLVFTWSRGAWVGILVALLLMLLLTHHRSLSWLILGVVPAIAASTFLPANILRRIQSISWMGDSSIRYRIHVWQGVGQMLRDYWLGGIGVGEAAFRRIYPDYAIAGTETVMHSHSLYLQLLCGLGIVGLLVFVVAMLLWARRAWEYYRYADFAATRWPVLAGMAGVGALLIMGMFDEVFYNYRIFFLFWTMLGMVNARVRIGREEMDREYNPVGEDRNQGEVTLRFYR